MFKNTFLFCVILCLCTINFYSIGQSKPFFIEKKILTGAEQPELYIPLLKDKKVGILTNQTGIITLENTKDTIHLVDFLLKKNIDLIKIFAPEHGFRGTADAGEYIKDGKDSKTNLPIISLYGKNKKPTKEQLKDIDIMLFDLQDVGVRFYTYISSLHYLMEACAENKIPIIILDRPNPIGSKVDGPTLSSPYQSFVGMHTIPILHGLTIGEYAQMINGEKWLKNQIICDITIIPCANYNKNMPYILPIKPSPNLPNNQSIQLYASLCFFEGTNVSVGRGTNMQFQIYGSPYLEKNNFSFIPKPNQGAKNPMYNGQKCYGENLSSYNKKPGIELQWLIKSYKETKDKKSFFNNFFTNLAGTKELQHQIQKGWSQEKIKQSWKKDIENFEKTRKKYLLYQE